MSCMLSTNDCVPAGAFIHLISGEVPSPGAAPGAAWLNSTGICPPSAKPVIVMVIGGPAGAPPRWPRSWAERGIARRRIARTVHRLVRMLSLLNGECRKNDVLARGRYERRMLTRGRAALSPGCEEIGRA